MGQLLAGKSIVIIGGTSGIGLSAAYRFKDEGADVAVLGLPGSASDEQKKSMLVLEGDAAQEGETERVIDQTQAAFGRFDGLYHVAGGSGRRFGDGPLHELTAEGWRTTFDMNMTSMMLSCRAAVRMFLKTGNPGVIVNLSSVLAWSPEPKHFATHAYAAAKAAAIGFSKSIAAYYAGQNIRVNVIAPGLVDTPMARRAAEDPVISNFIKTKQPLDGGRIGQPHDLDGATAFLMSDQARFITGQVLAIDGGWSLT